MFIPGVTEHLSDIANVANDIIQFVYLSKYFSLFFLWAIFVFGDIVTHPDRFFFVLFGFYLKAMLTVNPSSLIGYSSLANVSPRTRIL
jgi:hypothetical protein